MQGLFPNVAFLFETVKGELVNNSHDPHTCAATDATFEYFSPDMNFKTSMCTTYRAIVGNFTSTKDKKKEQMKVERYNSLEKILFT